MIAGTHVLELASQVSPVPEHTDVPQAQGTVVAAAVPSVVLHAASGDLGTLSDRLGALWGP